MMEGVERVRQALLLGGHADTIQAFSDGTRTAADAAAAIGCTVAQIAKSIVFAVAGGGAAVVVASGANRVDRRRAGEALGLRLLVADAAFVQDATGFEAGGVSPVGLVRELPMVLDEDLLRLEPLWAAAGSPRHVFRTTATELVRMTGGIVAGTKA